MKKRHIYLFLIVVALLITVTALGAKFGSDSSFGVFDPVKIENEAEPYVKFREEMAKLEEELEEFKARVYTEHSRKLKELTGAPETGKAGKEGAPPQKLNEDLQKRLQELAKDTQEQIDAKILELEAIRLKKEDALKEEFDSIIRELAKKHRLESILYKDASIIGGRDLTDEILDEWKRMYHPTWWDRLLGRGRKQN